MNNKDFNQNNWKQPRKSAWIRMWAISNHLESTKIFCLRKSVINILKNSWDSRYCIRSI